MRNSDDACRAKAVTVVKGVCKLPAAGSGVKTVVRRHFVQIIQQNLGSACDLRMGFNAILYISAANMQGQNSRPSFDPAC